MAGALSLGDGTLLAKLAAAAVGARLTGQAEGALTAYTEKKPLPPAITQPGASFVTLERRGALRGCVGSLVATRPLFRDTMRNAERAMADPRRPPVTQADWPELDVKVSVLTDPEEMPAGSRAELVAALRPGVDGLILAEGL